MGGEEYSAEQWPIEWGQKIYDFVQGKGGPRGVSPQDWARLGNHPGYLTRWDLEVRRYYRWWVWTMEMGLSRQPDPAEPNLATRHARTLVKRCIYKRPTTWPWYAPTEEDMRAARVEKHGEAWEKRYQEKIAPAKRVTQAEATSSDESSEEEADADAQEPLAEGSGAKRRHSSTDVEKAPDDDARRRKTQKQQPAAERVKRGARSPAPDPTPQVKAEVAGVGDPLGGQLSAFLSTLSPDFNFSRHTSLFLHQDIETPRQLRAIARGGEAELKALAEDLKKDVVGEDGARVKGMSAAWANRFVAVMMENVKKDGQA